MTSFTTTASFKDYKTPLFIFLIFEIVILAFSVYEESPLLVFAGIIASAVLIWSFYSVERTFYLFTFYIVLFPSYASYLRYPYLGMWVLLEVIAALILLMFFYDFSHRIIQQKKIFFQPATILDKMVFLFLVWSIFSTVWGLVYGGNVKFIYTEAYFLGLYIVYFLIRRNFDNEQALDRLWLVFNIAAVLVSFEYIYIAYRETGLGGGMLIRRVSTQQPHMAQLALPILLSYFLFKSKNVNKKLVLAGIIPLFLMTFFSQQRGLWLGILFSILLLWGFSFIREGVSLKNFIKFVFFLAVAVAFVAGVGLLIDKFFLGSTILTMAERFNTLLELAKDASLMIRMGEINNALEQWKDVPLIGTGFGATINPVILEHYSINLVDNSYIVFLWKSGLIGLVLYLALAVVFFARGLTIFKTTQNLQTQRMAAALMAGFAGLMVIALTNSCLAYYRYNVFWAMTFATIELLYWREKKIQQAARV